MAAKLRRRRGAPTGRWHPNSPDPFAYAFDEFDDRLRVVVAGRLKAWPDCIATPAREALHKS